MKKDTLHQNQSGLVSFMVVIIVMIVLTLIVLSFARLVRREQRQTLDRQLNSQAFYAAESGVNDAINALSTNPSLFNQDYNVDCNEFITDANLTNARQLDGPGGVITYSCLLVDTSPPELNFSSVPINESVAVPIHSANNTPITSLQISWGDSSGGTTISGCPTTVGAYPGRWNSNCQVGMLRLELVPFELPPFSAPPNRIDLIKERMITFVQPTRSGGTPSIAFQQASDTSPTPPFYLQGARHQATCNVAGAPRQCSVLITGLGLRNGYLRIRSIYRGAAVTIRAFAGAPIDVNRLDLAGAQAEIDATGRANDVLKRIKVSTPITVAGDFSPEFALQSTRPQCKRFEIAPGFINVFNGLANNNPCNPRQTIN